MATKQKYYVVWSGKEPGIYTSWADCKEQVDGIAGARYKSYPDMASARAAYEKGPERTPKPTAGPKTPKAPREGAWFKKSVSVDAACSGNPGIMEYRGVDTETGRQLFLQGPFPVGTNNIGEFLAIVHALAYLQKLDDPRPIYTDSRTALAWVKKKKVKTMLPENDSTAALWNLIHRAENWLATHSYPNPIIKWKTEEWGEIKADFGRK